MPPTSLPEQIAERVERLLARHAAFTNTVYLLHVIELVLFGLLLWRVETLPSLTSDSPEQKQTDEQSTPITCKEGRGSGATNTANIDLSLIEQLLAEHALGICVADTAALEVVERSLSGLCLLL